MFHCPVGVWVIEQRAIMLSVTVRSPTVVLILSFLISSGNLFHILDPLLFTVVKPISVLYLGSISCLRFLVSWECTEFLES